MIRPAAPGLVPDRRGLRRALRDGAARAVPAGRVRRRPPGATTRSSSAIPYLTDAANGGVTVNWATDRASTSAQRQVGQRRHASRARPTRVDATRTSITVGSTSEYQWTARLTVGRGHDVLLSRLRRRRRPAGRRRLPAVDRAGPGRVDRRRSSSPSSATGASARRRGNPRPGRRHGRQIAASGARFAVTTGDTGYPSGSQTNYGDLVQTGDNVSGVFGPKYWTKAGRDDPAVLHRGQPRLQQHLPDDVAEHDDRGRLGRLAGRWRPTAARTARTSASYPSAWYAFTQGNARFYVLTAAWPDGNVGTATNYKNDYDNHWTPNSRAVPMARARPRDASRAGADGVLPPPAVGRTTRPSRRTPTCRARTASRAC